MYSDDHQAGRSMKLINIKYQRINFINFSLEIALMSSKRHFVSQYQERLGRERDGFDSCGPFDRTVYERGALIDSKAVFHETR